MSLTPQTPLDPAPDLAVRIALRDRALRTLSELMAAEHSPGDRRQAATAALRYLALFENPRGNKSPSPPPTPPPDNSPPSPSASHTDPSALRFEPPPALAKSTTPRASGRSDRDPDFFEREEHYPYRKRVRTAPSPPRGEPISADLAPRSDTQPTNGSGQSPVPPLCNPTIRIDSDNHNHDHARAPPA